MSVCARFLLPVLGCLWAGGAQDAFANPPCASRLAIADGTHASSTFLMLSVRLANRPALRAVEKWLLVMQDRIKRSLQPLRITQTTLDILKMGDSG